MRKILNVSELVLYLSRDMFERVSSLFIIPLRNRGW